MPRKPRILSSTDIYHVTLRSINKHIIFEDSSDFQKYLYILSDCKAKFDIDILAYCLMSNHIHLLLHADLQNLASFFQSVGSRFVRWYNSKYSRCGHLFQERFFSLAVETQEQYLSTLVYIHNNPVKAGICRYPSEYHWSSHNAFYGEKNSLVDLSYSYNIAGSKDLLLNYYASNNISSKEAFFVDIHRMPNHSPTDQQALSTFKAVTRLSSSSDADHLSKTIRNRYIRTLIQEGLTQKQISRLMNVSVSTVKRVTKMNP